MSANFAYLNTRDLKFIVKEWLPTGGFCLSGMLTIIPRRGCYSGPLFENI